MTQSQLWKEEVERILDDVHCLACDGYQCDFQRRKKEALQELIELFSRGVTERESPQFILSVDRLWNIICKYQERFGQPPTTLVVSPDLAGHAYTLCNWLIDGERMEVELDIPKPFHLSIRVDTMDSTLWYVC